MEETKARSREITIEWLSEAQRLAKEDPARAQEVFGLTPRIQQAIKKASASRLYEIAQSGLIYFAPRSETVLEMALTGDRDWTKCALHMVSQKCR